MTITADNHEWTKEQFGRCNLKDQRHTRLLVQLASNVLCHLSGSLPEHTADMTDLKAAERLFACPDMNFEATASFALFHPSQRGGGLD